MLEDIGNLIHGFAVVVQPFNLLLMVVGIVLGVVVGLLILLAVFDAWTIIVPTAAVAVLLLLAYQSKANRGWLRVLRTKPLSWWVMTWFIATAICLTIVGTFFRGPGWSWVWPWGTHAV